MRLAACFALFQLAQLAFAQTYTVDPPTTAPADTIEDCTNWIIGEAGQTCEAIASDNFIDIDQLYRYNPSLKNSCNIVVGTSYCVEENWGIPPPVTTTSSTKPTTTVNPTPTPTQTGGVVEGCTKFYFVKKEDTCSSVLAANGITVAQLFAWNAGVKADCSGMWLGVYLCVAGPMPTGSLTTTTSSSTSTAIPTGPNGIATPTPTQPPSIVSNCNKFYYVEPGTTCSTVLSVNGITVAQLFAWNSGVGADCSGMWSRVHLCVGVIGGGGGTTTTTTQPDPTGPNGIVTPTPTQPPSIVSNCNKFYFVQPGTTCSAVLSANGITLAQLFAWNSGVGSDCSGMWSQVHLCVGVIGGTTTSKSTTSTQTTTAGNGIATPSPTQPPSIVSNCNKFYFVQPGTGCSALLSTNGITLAQLYAWNSGVGPDCAGMWASVWLCVGVIGGTTTPKPTTTVRTTTTSTTRGNGVATPTPTQPGMVTNCKTFYKVVEGDNCDTIISKTKVTKENLQKWNTGIGTSCNVWKDYYLCIAVL